MALVRMDPAAEAPADLHRSGSTTRCRWSSPAATTSWRPPTTVTLDDLSDEQLVRPHPSGWRPAADQLTWPEMTEGEAIEAVAAGTGHRDRADVGGPALPPQGRRRPRGGRPAPSTIALVWLRDRDDERTQAFVGVVKGRTANSSRS